MGLRALSTSRNTWSITLDRSLLDVVMWGALALWCKGASGPSCSLCILPAHLQFFFKGREEGYLFCSWITPTSVQGIISDARVQSQTRLLYNFQSNSASLLPLSGKSSPLIEFRFISCLFPSCSNSEPEGQEVQAS